MSAKFSNVLEDDSPELHRQFGCISGLFQVFDRQHFLARRRFGGHSQKGLALGNSSSESGGRSPKTVLTKNAGQNENHRTSSESSRTSFSSSSCSSSFSSLECSKSLQHEPSMFDFRDIVKDSVYRENPGLSVKTEAPKETRRVVVKNKDSPRPLPFSKSMDASYLVNGKSRASVDLDKSPSALAKPNERPWHFPEPRGSLRTSFDSRPREPTRYSCDGREVPRTSLDSQESRISAKLKEKPRFSLDSIQSSLKEAERRESNQRILRTLALHQDLEDNRRSPSVVGRLMGLEAMPADGQYLDDANEVQKRSTSCLHSPRVSEECKQDWPSSSPKVFAKEAVSMQNSSPHLRMPIEAAPWSQQEKIRMPSRKQESVYGEIARKLNELDFQQSNKDLRALKQILDAIKSKGLLEAKKCEQKQSKVADSHRTAIACDPNSMSVDGKFQRGSRNHLDSPIVIMKPAKSVNTCSSPPSSAKSLESLVGLRRVRTGDASESKRASGNKNRQVKDQSPRNGCRDGDLQDYSSTEKKPTSPRRQQSSSGTNVKSVGLSSPRMQQQKLALERMSRSEANKQRRQKRQSAESVSPRSRCGEKPRAEQTPSARLCRAASEMRNLRPQEDEISQRSDSNISLASQVDSEVTNSDQSPKLDFGFFHGNQTGVAVENSSLITKPKNLIHLQEDHMSPRRGVSSIQQPSPVSVLHESFYRDESPASPVDGGSFSCGDDEYQNVGDTACGGGWSSLAGSKHLFSVPHPNEIDLKKLGNIASLVKKLELLSSKDKEKLEGEQFDASWEAESTENQYISEMLLASGLLKDLSSGSLLDHAGYPINPELFLVLEQKMSAQPILESISGNASNAKTKIKKTHRKLIFDMTNEVLAKKLESICPGPQLAPSHHARKISCRAPSGKHLLRELCQEIEQLEKISMQASGSAFEEEEDILKLILSHDITRQSEGWTGNGMEVSGLVLDIERSVFKDLIDEVVRGEVLAFLQARMCRCRQLLAK